MGLNKEQDRVVDRALSVTNQSGTVYGAVAYQQGLYDGIRLIAELQQVNTDRILEKNQ